MKGLVFVLNRNNRKRNDALSHNKVDLRYLLKRYGSVSFFALMLICGVTVGSISCNSISEEGISRLDFFFITNISDRLQNGLIGTFCACFASNFIFWASSFLLGYSLWGIFFLPLIVFFKGFGVGVCAGYLFINYGLKGILFYTSVLLPGIFIVSMALIYQSSVSYSINKKMFRSLFAKDTFPFVPSAKIHLLQSFRYLLVALISAFVDMGLWCVFAGLFNF